MKRNKSWLVLLIVGLLLIPINLFVPDVSAATDTLYVDAYDEIYDEWSTENGNSPYLDEIGDDDWIHEAKAASAQEGWFDFDNTALSGSFTVNFSFYCYGIDGDDGWNIFYDKTGTGGGVTLGTPVIALTGGYQWITSIDLPDIYTDSEVNNMRIYLDTFNGGGGDDRYVDCCRMQIVTALENNAPTITGEVPINQSTDISLSPICNITANDADGESLTVTFYENTTDTYVLRQKNTSVTANSSVQWDSYTNADTGSTKYWWKVYVDDGTDNVSETYFFTTLYIWSNTAPSFSNPIPANDSSSISLQPTVNVTITDADGNNSVCTFYNSTDGVSWTWQQKNNTVLNESISYDYAHATVHSTLYYWKVTANDGNDNVSVIYHFTTEAPANTAPILTNESPTHTSDNNVYFPEDFVFDTIPYLFINCTDDDGHTMTVHWYSNSSGSWIKFAQNNSVLNETVTQGLTNWSTFGIWYYWSANVTDTYNWTNATYRFMISAGIAPADKGDDAGWRITSLPVNTTVSRFDVRVINATQNYSWQEAVDLEIILAFVYGWNEENQYYEFSSSFAPYRGYWIYLYDLSYELWVYTESVSSNASIIVSESGGNGFVYQLIFGALFLMIGLFIPFRKKNHIDKK